MKRIYIYAASCFFAALSAAIATYWFLFMHHIIETDDAYVRADFVSVGAQVDGYLTQIYANETDFVDKGQLLASLDSTDALTQLNYKKAALAWTVRQTQELIQGVNQAQSNLQLRKAELNKALFDYHQREQLMKNRVIAAEEYESVKASLEIAQASFDLAFAQLQNAAALAQAKSIDQHPLVLIAKEDLRKALINYHRLNIRAPVSGVIAKKTAQLGAGVNAARPLFVIAPLESVWIEANFKETQLETLRVGQSASIIADIYGKHINYKAKVIGIGAGAGSIFALIPPQNATGNWIKVVQRVPVRLEIDANQLKSKPLCIGSSVTVSVHTKDKSGKGIFAGSSMHVTQTTDLFQLSYEEIEHEVQVALQEAIDATKLSS